MFLCNVVPAWQTQHCIGYFAKKSFLLTMGNITEIISLHNIGPQRSEQHCRLFSCAKMFMGYGSTLHRGFSCTMLAQADQDNIV